MSQGLVSPEAPVPSLSTWAEDEGPTGSAGPCVLVVPPVCVALGSGVAVADGWACSVAEPPALDEPATVSPGSNLLPVAMMSWDGAVERVGGTDGGSVSPVYAAMVGNTSRANRQWALDAMTDAAVRQLSFGGRPEPFPGVPEL